MPANTRLEIEEDETRTHLIGKQAVFTFGQYRGEPLAEVYLKDPNYFMYLDRNMDPKYQFTKLNQAIMVFARMAKEEVTKQNQATSKSKFVGAEGEKIPLLTLKVYKKEIKEGRDFTTGELKPYTQYKFVDENENKFMAYNIEKYFPDVQQGDTIVCRAKVKGQKELMGIKFNFLNYVRPPKEVKVKTTAPKPTAAQIPP